MTSVWLAVAVLQGGAVLVAGWLIWRRGERNVILGVVFLGVGTVILVANVLWLVTGGPSGRSPIGMRGGMLGLGLSSLTAVEVLALGLLALGRTAPAPGTDRLHRELQAGLTSSDLHSLESRRRPEEVLLVRAARNWLQGGV